MAIPLKLNAGTKRHSPPVEIRNRGKAAIDALGAWAAPAASGRATFLREKRGKKVIERQQQGTPQVSYSVGAEILCAYNGDIHPVYGKIRMEEVAT